MLLMGGPDDDDDEDDSELNEDEADAIADELAEAIEGRDGIRLVQAMRDLLDMIR